MKKPTPISKPKAVEKKMNDGLEQSAVGAPKATPEQQRAMRQLQAQRLNAGFGQIVSLMMRHQAYRTHFIAELEWMIAPAVATGQFMIVERTEAKSGIPTPVAAVLWARVNAEVDARLTAAKQKPHLRPTEWTSGNSVWLVDAFGDTTETAKVIKLLAEREFAGSGLKVIERQADGSTLVRVLGRKTN